MGTKKKPGRWDCYKAALPDEPIFVIRAQDPLSAEIVDEWANRAELLGVAADKVAEARACAVVMADWPVKKVPD